jgi:hypothetical protein
MKDLTHNGRVSGWNLNSGPPEYEGVTRTSIGPQCSVLPSGKEPLVPQT